MSETCGNFYFSLFIFFENVVSILFIVSIGYVRTFIVVVFGLFLGGVIE
jgi:hypothetical protein